MKTIYTNKYRWIQYIPALFITAIFVLTGCDTEKLQSQKNGLDGTWQAIHYEKLDRNGNILLSYDLPESTPDKVTNRYVRIENNTIENITVISDNREENTQDSVIQSDPVIFLVIGTDLIPFEGAEEDKNPIDFKLDGENTLILTNLINGTDGETSMETITFKYLEFAEINGIVSRSEEFFPEVIPRPEREISHIRKRVNFVAAN